MELYFLGTAAGMPSRERNVTSIILNLLEEKGCFWLFDCGEGTIRQMIDSPLKLSKLEKVFITHMHGDHIYGLPGLVTSRSHQGGVSPLTIYGPQGLKEYLSIVLKLSGAQLEFPLIVEEIGEGVIFRDEGFEVSAGRLDHRVESFGYRIVERDRPGRLKVEQLAEMGIPPGPLYGKIKKEKEVRLDDGRIIRSADFVGERIPGRIIAILGDTRAVDSAVELARNADVLVHEATYAHELHERAVKYKHSTALEAAQLANKAGVRTLIMTHFSSRYKGEGIRQLLDEARSIHPDTYAAADFWTYRVHEKTDRLNRNG